MDLYVAIGVPVLYVLIGLLSGRVYYTKNHDKYRKSDLDGQTAIVVIGWPFFVVIGGAIYFVTNGVRKKNNPKKVKSS